MVHREWADTIAAALLEGQGCIPAGKSGRGDLLRFPYEQGWGVVRPYLRGGFARHFLRDAYVLANRPLRELRIHARLYQAGLSVPQPLGVCWERHGPLLRGALATHEVEAANLLNYLQQDPRDPEPTLRGCGALVRQMHDMGLFHADLQARNILIGDDQLYLIDFDKARFLPELNRLQRARNLFRLRRSLEKNGLDMAHFRPICEGYGDEALPGWASRIYRVKGKLSDMAAGRGTPHDQSPDR